MKHGHISTGGHYEANLAGACDAGAGGLSCFIWLRRRGRVKFPTPASSDKSHAHASLNTHTHACANSNSHSNPLPDTSARPLSGMLSL